VRRLTLESEFEARSLWWLQIWGEELSEYQTWAVTVELNLLIFGRQSSWPSWPRAKLFTTYKLVKEVSLVPGPGISVFIATQIIWH
jgi:hypothetical protein